MKVLKESKLVESASYKVSYKVNGKNHFSTVSAENEKEATRIVSEEIIKKYGNNYQFIGVEEVTNESMDTDDLSYYYDEEDIIDALNDVWVEVGSKSIPDSNGFMTDYTMYRNINTGEYVFVFGDKDIYRPEDGYFDWECETEQEAQEWFNNYHGFEESGFDDFEESYEVDKVFSAACNNRMDYMKKGFAKGKINPNDRFNRFNSDHSYIMGALRNGNKDMVKLLQDQGGTILDNEQDEYNYLMGEEFEKEETTNNDEKVHTKSNGDYLVKASSGHGYTAFNKHGVCIGGITTDSETEAKNKFMSNKLDERYKGYNRARRLDESLFEDADEFEFDDEFNSYYKGYTEEDEDENSAYNRLKNNQTNESKSIKEDKSVVDFVGEIEANKNNPEKCDAIYREAKKTLGKYDMNYVTDVYSKHRNVESKSIKEGVGAKTFAQWFDETQSDERKEYYPFSNYVKVFPNAEVLKDATAEDIRNYAHRFYSVYDVDSVDREKAFNFASEELGIDYDDFYYAWIKDQPMKGVNESLIDRKFFKTLEKDNDGNYIVLNDGNFVKHIIADNDEDAIKQFRTTLKEATSKNETYKDYVIVVDPAGDGYNVFSKKGNKLTLEDEGFASINHAKAEIDKWVAKNESKSIKEDTEEDLDKYYILDALELALDHGLVTEQTLYRKALYSGVKDYKDIPYSELKGLYNGIRHTLFQNPEEYPDFILKEFELFDSNGYLINPHTEKPWFYGIPELESKFEKTEPQKESFEDNDIDKPFTHTQVFDELKRETNNFTIEKDTYRYGFLVEAEMAQKILAKHYAYAELDSVGSWFQIDFGDPKKKSKKFRR